MKYYAIFNDNGFATAFFIEKINKRIPKSAVGITEKDWKDLKSNQGKRRYVDGKIVKYDPPLEFPQYVIDRQSAYEKKEKAGDLPNGVIENIDELWKALEAAEINGTELPPSASSIIRHRRAVKNKYPKE